MTIFTTSHCYSNLFLFNILLLNLYNIFVFPLEIVFFFFVVDIQIAYRFNFSTKTLVHGPLKSVVGIRFYYNPNQRCVLIYTLTETVYQKMVYPPDSLLEYKYLLFIIRVLLTTYLKKYYLRRILIVYLYFFGIKSAVFLCCQY